jgi:hypothetical protein
MAVKSHISFISNFATCSSTVVENSSNNPKIEGWGLGLEGVLGSWGVGWNCRESQLFNCHQLEIIFSLFQMTLLSTRVK